ncbi:MAG: hypothetical protein A2X94_13100 [Bdellovibrionales bacterium GWB1_55_8]|nr:MAG: hypothetical protein A2X94_13100 [Bdellovibrionales bacterium GWB1_55_8]
MSRGILMFFGVLATYISALFGINLIPKFMLERVRPEGTMLPYAYTEQELRGRRVYVREGCVYCHSQQIRAKQNGSDMERGWGQRPTVAQDYVHDSPVLLGTMRTGPDLANIGVRQPSDDWHLKHLYNPRITSPGSIMPPYPWLFMKQGEYDRGMTLDLPQEFAPEAGAQVIPTQEALDLVAYLKSLKRNYKVEGLK